MVNTRKQVAKSARGRAARTRRPRRYVLKLYVAGMTSNSTRAIANIKRLCEEQLAGEYDLQVVDLYRQPRLAQGEQIIAAPTLIRKLPLPLRKFIGDMSNNVEILVGLDVKNRRG